MTVVVCRILENGYEIAADSITVRGYTQTKGENTDQSKLFEVNGVVVGCTGLLEEGALLELFLATHSPGEATRLAMLEFLSEFADWKRKKTDSGDIENSYFIGFENKVFAIERWLIETVVTYEAIGAGMDFALAALYLGQNAEKAVETAIELSVFCESPIQVIKKTVEEQIAAG